MENEPLDWTADELSKFVQQYVPDIFEAILDPGTDVVVLENYKLAPNMHSTEFLGIGAIIKFASIYKKEIRIKI